MTKESGQTENHFPFSLLQKNMAFKKRQSVMYKSRVWRFLYVNVRVTIRRNAQESTKEKNMDYKEFKESFKNDIKAALGDKGMDVTVEENRTEKLNQAYDAVSIKPEGSRIGVNLNMESAYKAYEDGTPFDEVVAKAAESAASALENVPDLDIDSLTDYSVMKEKLSMEVVSADRNEEMLKNVPHKQMEDMAVVYRLVLDENNSGNGTILVTDKMMEQFGVTPEQLHEDAMKNSPEIRPSEIKGMSEILGEMMGTDAIPMIDPADEQMFVATVPDKNRGAGVIAYPDFMEDAAVKLEGDFYVIPSSVHEVILVKDDGRMTAKDLEAMVKDVNATQVAPEDRLTDHVYHYDSKEHLFELADKYEQRQAENDIEKDTDERTDGKDSVLGDLKAKKEEAAKKAPEKHAKDAVKKTRGGEAL